MQSNQDFFNFTVFYFCEKILFSFFKDLSRHCDQSAKSLRGPDSLATIIKKKINK